MFNIDISQAMGIEDDPNSISYGRVSRDDLKNKIPVKKKVSIFILLFACSLVKLVSLFTCIPALYSLCGGSSCNRGRLHWGKDLL
jgi:hypothetical protein